jgi:hypothetical protein
MMMAIRVIGLVLAAAAIGCDRGKPREQPAPAESQAATEAAELRKSLEVASESARQWERRAKDMEARAKAAEADLAKATDALVRKDTETAKKVTEGGAKEASKSSSESIPNERRPVGDRVIRAWDKHYSMWRDVRIKDIDWHMIEKRVDFGMSKDKTDHIILVIRDQVSEAWVIEFVTGKKVDIPQR